MPEQENFWTKPISKRDFLKGSALTLLATAFTLGSADETSSAGKARNSIPNPNGPKVGISFSSGAERAIYHVGVYLSLIKHGIPIHVLGGCSGGSIIAATIAAACTIPENLDENGNLTEDVVNKLIDFCANFDGYNSWKKYLHTDLPEALVSHDVLREIVRNFVPRIHTKELNRELVIPAMSMSDGKIEDIAKSGGYVDDFCISSSSQGGMFNDYKGYTDPAVIDPLGVKYVLDRGVNILIVSDVSKLPPGSKPDNIVEKVQLIFQYTAERSRLEGLEKADIKLEPDFTNIDFSTPAGKRAAADQGFNDMEKQIPKLLKLLEKKKLFTREV